MSSNREKNLLAETKEALVRRILDLEKELDRTAAQRDEAYELAKEALNRSRAHEEQNAAHHRRIQELEDPQGRQGKGLGWIGKAVHVIKQHGRPMRAQEIIHELRARDKEGLLQFTDDPEAHLSSVLSKAKKLGRLKVFKVAGTRGGYYAIEDWVDEAGKLIPEMKAQLL